METNRKKLLLSFIYIIAAVFAAYFAFKYALPALFPFLVSFFIACSVQGAAERFSARTGVKKRHAALCFGLLLLGAFALFCFLCLSKLWAELSELVGGAIDVREEILERTQSLLLRLEGFLLRFFPAAEENAELLRAGIELFAAEAMRSVISALSTQIPAFMGSVFSQVPKILFSLAVTLISCVYLCLDFDLVRGFFSRLAARGGFPLLAKVPRASFAALAKYLRALFFIFLLTASVLALGFLILGVRYAWLLAVFTAFIDALPLFGSGAVLIPLSLYSFVTGDFGSGGGLLLLWALCALVRQLAEPRIMGKNLGLHPLLNLAAVYVGYSFFGVTGVVFLPITVVILKNLSLGQKL